MTLAVFPPQRLDDLALRMLDLAGLVRHMAEECRKHRLNDFQLHGQKIDEWLSNLEDWAHDGKARLQAELIRREGRLRGELLLTESKSAKKRAAKTKKSR